MLLGPFKEANQDVVEFEDSNATVIELWFRILHGKMTDAMYSREKIGIKQIWTAIQTGRQYLLPIEYLEGWFEKWFHQNSGGPDLPNFDNPDLRALLYPCLEFDCANGFAGVTEKLAYNSGGHITEINPTQLKNLHVPNRLIGMFISKTWILQLNSDGTSHVMRGKELTTDGRILGGINSARENLKCKLLAGIQHLQEEIILCPCDMKMQALFNFEVALHKTRVWPLESKVSDKEKSSLQQVLRELNTLDYESPEGVVDCSCSKVSVDSKINDLILEVQDHFQGLCLDCVDISKATDLDSDYWNHTKPFDDYGDDSDDYENGDYYEMLCSDLLEKRWDPGCRVIHGQATWYFSWISRKQIQDAHEKEREQRKKKKELAERKP